jgi:hypothetical protein
MGKYILGPIVALLLLSGCGGGVATVASGPLALTPQLTVHYNVFGSHANFDYAERRTRYSRCWLKSVRLDNSPVVFCMRERDWQRYWILWLEGRALPVDFTLYAPGKCGVRHPTYFARGVRCNTTYRQRTTLYVGNEGGRRFGTPAGISIRVKPPRSGYHRLN